MSEDGIITQWEGRRRVEALLFAASEALSVADLAAALPQGTDIDALLTGLAEDYRNRGIHLVEVGGRWQFRTAPDLAFLLRRESDELKRLSRAAVETLAIIAYHQPVTRADIEHVRGVAVSRGTIDVLMEAGWVRPRGRRQTPGRPMQYGTSQTFLEHFGLESLEDLPGLKELAAMGLMDEDGAVGPDAEQMNGEADSQIDLEDAIQQASHSSEREE